MSKKRVKRDDVIKISQSLVKFNGDTKRVFNDLNRRYSEDIIDKIKEKKFMAAISNMYFKRNAFKKGNDIDVDSLDISNVVRPTFDIETDFVTINTTTNTKETTKEIKTKVSTFISMDTVEEIAKSLVKNNGDLNKTLEETKHLENVNYTKIRDIAYKRSHAKFTDQFFKKSFSKLKKEKECLDISFEEAVDRSINKLKTLTLNDLAKFVDVSDMDERIEFIVRNMTLSDIVKILKEEF